MSVSRVNCKRIEDLLEKGCEGLRKLSRKSNGGYIFDGNFCNLSDLGYVGVSCQFSCERIEDLRFNMSDTGYVGYVSRQLQSNRRFI